MNFSLSFQSHRVDEKPGRDIYEVKQHSEPRTLHTPSCYLINSSDKVRKIRMQSGIKLMEIYHRYFSDGQILHGKVCEVDTGTICISITILQPKIVLK